MKLATTTLVFCVAALLALGMVMLYSSSMADKGMPLKAQLVWCALGLAGGMMMAALDYRLLKKFAWPIFGVSVVLLALVLVPHVGVRLNGARRWLKVPHTGMGFEPSELGKIALIIILAWACGERYQRQMVTWRKGIVIPGLIIGVVLGLVILEPDCGTMILLAAVAGAMLLIAGVQWKFILPPGHTGLAGLGFLWHNPMRTKRIFAWLHADEHKMDIGYQANQAMLALGSGGWTGLGIGNSRQKLGFLPEHDSDFIFSIIGEELGLIATLLVVAAFVVLVVCGLYIACRSSDNFGLLLGSGITFLIGFQACINIGVVTSALPNKGLPLPFISRGGSSLFMMLIGVGLLLSVARRARILVPAARNKVEPDAFALPQPS